MNKPDFIQRFAIRCCPKGDDALEACVEAAEGVWDYLCARGYGSKQKGEPRRSEDHCAKLSPDQRRDFDQFWKAFNWKHDKQPAARRWKELNPDLATVEHILYAAKKTAEIRDPRNGTPIYAEGWLNRKRWTDWDLPRPKDTTPKADLGEKRHAQEMAGLCRMQGKDDLAETWDKRAGEL